MKYPAVFTLFVATLALAPVVLAGDGPIKLKKGDRIEWHCYAQPNIFNMFTMFGFRSQHAPDLRIGPFSYLGCYRSLQLPWRYGVVAVGRPPAHPVPYHGQAPCS